MKEKEVELKLKELRKTRNLSQEELANRLGVSRQSIISIERGEYLPSLPLVLDILSFFEVPLEDIIYCEHVNLNNLKGGEKDMPREIIPFSPFGDIDRFFDEPIVRWPSIPSVNMPGVNVRETDKNVIVEAELPGVREEDVDLELNDDNLTIRGQKKTEEEVKEKDYYRREFVYGSFTRTIVLPKSVESDKAEAELKNGVLKITFPKYEEKVPKGKKIEIKKK